MTRPSQQRSLPAEYLGFFDCFNTQRFFEAHDVLEALWLKERGGINDRFYKGLIQLAGAFVHVQKQRAGPAIALFKLAQANVGQYGSSYQGLAVSEVLKLAGRWVARLESDPSAVASRDFPLLPRPA